MAKKKKIVIIGAGISGLSTAHGLVNNDNYEIHIIEQSGEGGGKAKTNNYGNGKIREHSLR